MTNKWIDQTGKVPEHAIVHAPVLTIRPAAVETRGVALILHGGRQRGHQRVRARHLSPTRMIPFARLIHRWGAESGLAVWSLRNRVRGWNGEERSPIQDARWALERITSEHPGLPIYLVGHSMGGSVALAVADDPQVDAVVSLAPWLEKDSPTDVVAGRCMLIVHGSKDRWTSAPASLDYARRAVGTAREVHYVSLQGVGHFMFTRVNIWHRLTASFILRSYAGRTGTEMDPEITAPADWLYAQGNNIPVTM